MKVSVVIPTYNEEKILERTAAKLDEIMRGLAVPYEIIFINDGSSDGTEETLEALGGTLPNISHYSLSRNFGKEAAMSAGLDVAGGDCVILLDADLQHPPDLIPTLYAKWREGYEVVNAVKSHRGTESAVYRLFAGAFNRIMTAAIGVDSSRASDFKLIDRQVVEALKAFPERNRFFRGLVSWVGFRVIDVPFDVQERIGGESKWKLTGLIRYSVKNIISFSSWPLIFIAYVGFLTVLAGVILLIHTLYNYFVGNSLGGFTTVISIQILLSGIILFSLGIISVYLAKIYDEQKARPMFIVRKDGKTEKE